VVLVCVGVCAVWCVWGRVSMSVCVVVWCGVSGVGVCVRCGLVGRCVCARGSGRVGVARIQWPLTLYPGVDTTCANYQQSHPGGRNRIAGRYLVHGAGAAYDTQRVGPQWVDTQWVGSGSCCG